MSFRWSPCNFLWICAETDGSWDGQGQLWGEGSIAVGLRATSMRYYGQQFRAPNSSLGLKRHFRGLERWTGDGEVIWRISSVTLRSDGDIYPGNSPEVIWRVLPSLRSVLARNGYERANKDLSKKSSFWALSTSGSKLRGHSLGTTTNGLASFGSYIQTELTLAYNSGNNSTHTIQPLVCPKWLMADNKIDLIRCWATLFCCLQLLQCSAMLTDIVFKLLMPQLPDEVIAQENNQLNCQVQNVGFPPRMQATKLSREPTRWRIRCEKRLSQDARYGYTGSGYSGVIFAPAAVQLAAAKLRELLKFLHVKSVICTLPSLGFQSNSSNISPSGGSFASTTFCKP